MGQEQIQGRDPPPLSGRVVRAAATKGVPKLSLIGGFTNTPDPSAVSYKVAPGPPLGTAHLEGKPSPLGDLRCPGTNSGARAPTAPPGRMGFPQTVASPKATKCPTEKSAMAPTCSQTPENRLDGSCIPNGGGRGEGGGSLKAGRDL